jgi:hypothetical protein
MLYDIKLTSLSDDSHIWKHVKIQSVKLPIHPFYSDIIHGSKTDTESPHTAAAGQSRKGRLAGENKPPSAFWLASASE